MGEEQRSRARNRENVQVRKFTSLPNIATYLPARGLKKLVVSGFAFVLYNGVIQRKSSGNDEGECDC